MGRKVLARPANAPMKEFARYIPVDRSHAKWRVARRVFGGATWWYLEAKQSWGKTYRAFQFSENREEIMLAFAKKVSLVNGGEQ